MSYKICLCCYEIFYPNQVKSMAMCPRLECGGTVLIEIDDLMMPTIIELNRKAYYTQFCCSSHLPELMVKSIHKEIEERKFVYVDFHPDLSDEISKLVEYPFEFVPTELANPEMKNFCTVKITPPEDLYSLDIMDRLDFIVESNKLFYQWAKSLPKSENKLHLKDQEFKIFTIERDSEEFKKIQSQLDGE